MNTATGANSPSDRLVHTMHIVREPKGWTVLRNDGRPMLLDPADHQPAYLEQRSEVEAQCHALGLVEVAEGNPAGWPAGTLVRLSIGGQPVVGSAQDQGIGSATTSHDNGSRTSPCLGLASANSAAEGPAARSPEEAIGASLSDEAIVALRALVDGEAFELGTGFDPQDDAGYSLFSQRSEWRIPLAQVRGDIEAGGFDQWLHRYQHNINQPWKIVIAGCHREAARLRMQELTLDERMDRRNRVSGKRIAQGGSTQTIPELTAKVIRKISPADDNALTVKGVEKGCMNPGEMPQYVFLLLQRLEESMASAAAQGQDCVEGFEEIRREVNRLLDAAPWTLHPDYGCVPVDEAARRDREPSPTP